MSAPIAEYPQWRNDRCQHCAAGMAMSLQPGIHHTGNANPPKCEAPDSDDLIAELLREVDSWHRAFAHAIMRSPEEAFQYSIGGKSIEIRAREWFESAVAGAAERGSEERE